jgi:hypothetical protein
LVVIINNAPGGRLHYEILLVGPAYFICLGCDAGLLFFAIQLDRQSGRASRPAPCPVDAFAWGRSLIYGDAELVKEIQSRL